MSTENKKSSSENLGEQNGSPFFALISRLKYIKRWGLMKNTECEDVMQHTAMTAVIAHALCVISNTYFNTTLNGERAAVMALYHETGEIVTGDLPTPVKYRNKEIQNSYKAIESDAALQMLSLLPEEMQKIYSPIIKGEFAEEKMVKAADKIGALIKCSEELAAGNKEFEGAYASTDKYLKDLNNPAVQYFLDNFLPYFGKTLDFLFGSMN